MPHVFSIRDFQDIESVKSFVNMVKWNRVYHGSLNNISSLNAL